MIHFDSKQSQSIFNQIYMKMRWRTITSNVSIRTISPTATPLPKAYDCVAVYIAGRRTNLVAYGWRPKPPTNNHWISHIVLIYLHNYLSIVSTVYIALCWQLHTSQGCFYPRTCFVNGGWSNSLPWNSPVCLHSQLGYFTVVFQAFGLIVLKVFGAAN